MSSGTPLLPTKPSTGLGSTVSSCTPLVDTSRMRSSKTFRTTERTNMADRSRTGPGSLSKFSKQ